MKQLRIIRAGPYIRQALSPRINPRDGPEIRQRKRQESSPAVVFMNQKNSWQRLKLLLAENYPAPGSGLVCTLTFDDAHLPRNRGKTLDRLEYFRTNLREDRRQAGLPDPRIFWAPEVLTSARGRWHVHMVIDSTGRDVAMIRRRWIYGERIEAEPLRVDSEKNHETLARYMSKELREAQEYTSKPGLHGWSHTRNILKPEVSVEMVPDDFELIVPPGYEVIYDESRQTQIAGYHVQECFWRGEPNGCIPDFY